MPRNPKNIQKNINFTPAEYAAIEADVQRTGLDFSSYIRMILAQNVPGFVVETARRGTYPRNVEVIEFLDSLTNDQHQRLTEALEADND